jgi:hypothetical protein
VLQTSHGDYWFHAQALVASETVSCIKPKADFGSTCLRQQNSGNVVRALTNVDTSAPESLWIVTEYDSSSTVRSDVRKEVVQVQGESGILLTLLSLHSCRGY